jgi:hypothetical protein
MVEAVQDRPVAVPIEQRDGKTLVATGVLEGQAVVMDQPVDPEVGEGQPAGEQEERRYQREVDRAQCRSSEPAMITASMNAAVMTMRRRSLPKYGTRSSMSMVPVVTVEAAPRRGPLTLLA